MKILASDFDGTIFYRHHDYADPRDDRDAFVRRGFRDADLEAIARFQAEGNKFGICSGRSVDMVTDNLPPELKLDFIIGSSGAAIFDAEGNPIYETFMPDASAREVMAKFPYECMGVITSQGVYQAKVDPFLMTGAKQLDELKPEEGEHFIGISGVIGTPESARALKEKLDPIEGIEVFQNKDCLDIVPEGCSKGVGLQTLAKHYGCERQDTFAIGDSYNDLPMLEAAGFSFTFPESPASVRNTAGGLADTVADAIGVIESLQD